MNGLEFRPYLRLNLFYRISSRCHYNNNNGAWVMNQNQFVSWSSSSPHKCSRKIDPNFDTHTHTHTHSHTHPHLYEKNSNILRDFASSNKLFKQNQILNSQTNEICKRSSLRIPQKLEEGKDYLRASSVEGGPH